MIKGVIFDLDGVIVSTDELHYEAWKKLAKELGITDFTRKDNEKQRGVSRMESLEVVLAKSSRQYTEEEKVQLADRKNNYYKEMLKTLDKSALLPGSEETLLKLKEKNILTALGSASQNAITILKQIEIYDLFNEISSGLDVTRSKPDPQVFLVAAQKLGLDPSECLVVEDSKAGIVAAKAGGMKSLAVGPFYKTLGGDYEAENLRAEIDWEIILQA